MKNNTSTIHTFYSNSPSYKVESRKNNKGIAFNPIKTNPIIMYMIIPLVIMFLLLLEDVSPWAILIFLGVISAVVFFQSMLENAAFIFDVLTLIKTR